MPMGNVERNIYIFKDIEDDVVESVVRQIVEINLSDANNPEGQGDNPIKIYISTRGGQANCGLAIANAIMSSKTPVHTICIGQAMSIGFLLLASGHKRFMMRNSVAMYHEPYIENLGGGIYSLLDIANSLCKSEEPINNILLSRTLLESEDIERMMMSKADTILTPVECMKFGIIDAIIDEIA